MAIHDKVAAFGSGLKQLVKWLTRILSSMLSFSKRRLDRLVSPRRQAQEWQRLNDFAKSRPLEAVSATLYPTTLPPSQPLSLPDLHSSSEEHASGHARLPSNRLTNPTVLRCALLAFVHNPALDFRLLHRRGYCLLRLLRPLLGRPRPSFPRTHALHLFRRRPMPLGDRRRRPTRRALRLREAGW